METIETLAERATFMRESLQKNQTVTDNMVTILGSFDHRLSALEAAMRPTQVFSLTNPRKLGILSLASSLKRFAKVRLIWYDRFFFFPLFLVSNLQVRTHSIRKAHENIDKVMKSCDVILEQFDLSRKVSFALIWFVPLWILYHTIGNELFNVWMMQTFCSWYWLQYERICNGVSIFEKIIV